MATIHPSRGLPFAQKFQGEVWAVRHWGLVVPNPGEFGETGESGKKQTRSLMSAQLQCGSRQRWGVPEASFRCTKFCRRRPPPLSRRGRSPSTGKTRCSSHFSFSCWPLQCTRSQDYGPDKSYTGFMFEFGNRTVHLMADTTRDWKNWGTESVGSWVGQLKETGGTGKTWVWFLIWEQFHCWRRPREWKRNPEYRSGMRWWKPNWKTNQGSKVTLQGWNRENRKGGKRELPLPEQRKWGIKGLRLEQCCIVGLTITFRPKYWGEKV